MIRHGKTERAFIAGRDRNTDEATFLMCLVADAGAATIAYLKFNQMVTVKSTGEKRVRYEVTFTKDDDKYNTLARAYATMSLEEAKKYAYFDRKAMKEPFKYDFIGDIITKAEYESYLEMKVLPHVRVGTSFPKYP